MKKLTATLILGGSLVLATTAMANPSGPFMFVDSSDGSSTAATQQGTDQAMAQGQQSQDPNAQATSQADNSDYSDNNDDANAADTSDDSDNN